MTKKNELPVTKHLVLLILKAFMLFAGATTEQKKDHTGLPVYNVNTTGGVDEGICE
jgi:hypothetical protein